jgi:5-methylthioadenosine/S-adenosylhomocysteine deaminase
MRIAPHAVYTCTPAYLQECGELARKYGVGLHMHLSETEWEVADCQNRYGKRPPALLEDVGLLELPLTAAHCVHLTEGEVDLLAQCGVIPVHCPASNLKLASGFAPVQAMLQRGMTVALGTDGAASNNNLSIFQEMKLAALLAKGAAMDPTALPAQTALAMANRNGAMALGLFDEIGSLEPGKKADLLLLYGRRPHHYPQGEYIAQIVYSGHSSDVRSLWIDGRRVYEDGRFLTLDIERAAAETQRIVTRIHGR